MPDDNRPLSQGEIDALLDALSSNPPDEGSAQASPQPREAPQEDTSSSAPSPKTPPYSSTDDPRLKRTMHLPVTVFVSLGEKSLPIRSLLNWGVGTQITLNREWKRALAIKINGLDVGEGRVVLVGNNFGIEVTQWGKTH